MVNRNVASKTYSFLGEEPTLTLHYEPQMPLWERSQSSDGNVPKVPKVHAITRLGISPNYVPLRLGISPNYVPLRLGISPNYVPLRLGISPNYHK
jgi:hypothetical protein